MALTPKQEKFCQKYVECGNASAAYRHAYDSDKMKPATINRMAKANMDNHKISARVAELMEESKEKAMATFDQKVKLLWDIAETLGKKQVDENGVEVIGDAASSIRAVNELNRMFGDHAPEKHEHKTNMNLSGSIEVLNAIKRKHEKKSNS